MLRYALIAVISEKIIQHIVVTIAFWRNTRDVRSTVALDPGLLMILGVVLTLLFVLALWGIIRRLGWAPNLLIGLALFDIVGKFAAQGKLAIAITVSFLVAILLLILTLFYRRQLLQHTT